MREISDSDSRFRVAWVVQERNQSRGDELPLRASGHPFLHGARRVDEEVHVDGNTLSFTRLRLTHFAGAGHSALTDRAATADCDRWAAGVARGSRSAATRTTAAASSATCTFSGCVVQASADGRKFGPISSGTGERARR